MEEIKRRIKVVVDTNIIISAIIKSKKIKYLILNEEKLELYSPATVYYEIIKNCEDILKYTTLSEREIWYILTTKIPKRIKIIDETIYLEYLKEAYQIAKQFDEKDTPFIALALKLNIPIWTGDIKMIKYGLVTEKFIAIDTLALEELLKGKSLEEIKENLKKRYLK